MKFLYKLLSAEVAVLIVCPDGGDSVPQENCVLILLCFFRVLNR